MNYPRKNVKVRKSLVCADIIVMKRCVDAHVPVKGLIESLQYDICLGASSHCTILAPALTIECTHIFQSLNSSLAYRVCAFSLDAHGDSVYSHHLTGYILIQFKILKPLKYFILVVDYFI